MRFALYLVGIALAVLLSACGGGASTGVSTSKPPVPAPRVPAVATAQVPPHLAARQLLDFAEKAFGDHFPSREHTRLLGPFAYRFYPQTGLYLGVVVAADEAHALGDVYVLGGAFGDSPWPAGHLTRFITPVAPLPVQRSSYDNKMAAGAALGPQSVHPLVNGYAFDSFDNHYVDAGYAFGDFFGDGTYSLVTTARDEGIRFWRQQGDRWEDRTAELLADTTPCDAARKAMVGDLNGDGRPDVAFACAPETPQSVYAEPQRILLSRDDGTYGNVQLPYSAFAHGGTLADTRGDGFADIVYTDTLGRQKPFYLRNNKDGTFTEMEAKLPDGMYREPVYSIEFVDANGDDHFDLWAGGSYFPSQPGNAFRSRVYWGDASGSFDDSRVLLSAGIDDVVALDFVLEGGAFYTLCVPAAYNGTYIVRTALAQDAQPQKLYEHFGPYFEPDWVGGRDWPPWIVAFEGRVVASSALFSASAAMLHAYNGAVGR